MRVVRTSASAIALICCLAFEPSASAGTPPRTPSRRAKTSELRTQQRYWRGQLAGFEQKLALTHAIADLDSTFGASDAGPRIRKLTLLTTEHARLAGLPQEAPMPLVPANRAGVALGLHAGGLVRLHGSTVLGPARAEDLLAAGIGTPAALLALLEAHWVATHQLADAREISKLADGSGAALHAPVELRLQGSAAAQLLARYQRTRSDRLVICETFEIAGDGKSGLYLSGRLGYAQQSGPGAPIARIVVARDSQGNELTPTVADYRQHAITDLQALERRLEALVVKLAGLHGQASDPTLVAKAKLRLAARIADAEALSGLLGHLASHRDLDLLVRVNRLVQLTSVQPGTVELMRHKGKKLLYREHASRNRHLAIVDEMKLAEEADWAGFPIGLASHFGIDGKRKFDQAVREALLQIAPEDIP